MGRWSQRRRGRGGGGGPGQIFLIEAQVIANDNIRSFWSTDITTDDLAPTDFTTLPSNFVADLISQVTPDRLELTWLDDISAETDLVYSGTKPNLPTPQQVTLT